MTNWSFSTRLLGISGIVVLVSNVYGFQPTTVNNFGISRSSSRVDSAVVTEVSSDVQSIISSEDNASSSSSSPKKNKRVSVLVCPAQFCVPDDYNVLFENLAKLSDKNNNNKNDADALLIPEIGTCKVAPLPRTEWIKVARQLPTRNFLEATLPVHSTLGWYFDAVEQGLSEILAEEGPDANICIIGHSIGGWVARAYLGGLGKSSRSISEIAKARCSSLITLGTPHISPDSALVDQTRGLLREIAETPSCSSQSLADLGIDITCVCSSGLSGNFFTTNVEQLVAASSYLPLLGRVGGDVLGDGIVPLDLAFMESPARRIQIEKCKLTGAPVRHSHVLPTPWNLWNGYAPSIVLPETFASYTSEGVIPQWAKYIR